MKIRMFTMLILFLGLSLSAFATWIPAQIYCITDGKPMACNVEYSSGQGKIEASNATTGEKFRGNYTAVWVSEILARGRAILVGDQGTVIFLSLEVSRGTLLVYPVFYGDGEDNKGVKYQIQSKV